PLRELARQRKAIVDSELYVFPTPEAYLVSYRSYAGTRFTGNAYYKGTDRPYGALVSFYVNEILKKDGEGMAAAVDTAMVEVRAAGSEKMIRRFKTAIKKGMNRISWGLEIDGVRMPMQPKPAVKDTLFPGGRPVLPGTYYVTIRYGTLAKTVPVNVNADPRIQFDEAAVANFYGQWDDYNNKIAQLTDAMDNLRASKQQTKRVLQAVAEQMEDPDDLKLLQDTTKAINKKIDALMTKVMQGPEVQGIFNDPDMLNSKLFEAGVFFNPAFGTPNPGFHGITKNHMNALQNIDKDIFKFIAEVDDFERKEWAAYRQLVRQMRLQMLPDWPELR
ncbi:MAG: hypothetical protein AAF798_20720, partial [Bacteroidota bacterium]